MTSVKLTTAQREYLQQCMLRPMSSWDAGSTTIAVLREKGLIEAMHNGSMAVNVITAAGIAWLKEQA